MENLTEKEKAFVDSIKEMQSKAITDLKEGLISKETFEQKIKELTDKLTQMPNVADAVANAQKEMQKQYDELSIQLKKDLNSDGRKLMFHEHIANGIKEKMADLKEIMTDAQSKKHIALVIDMKTVGDMTFTNSITGEIPQAYRLSGYNEIAVRNPFIRELITTALTAKPTISYVYEVAGEGGADTTTEGSTKNQLDADFAVGSVSVAKYTVYIRISEEMLDDVDYMATYVGQKLMQNLNLKIDAVILAAIVSAATAYSAGTFASTITAPNNFDVLLTSLNQSEINNHMPTTIIMHPSDVTAMMMVKNSTHDYTVPPFAAFTGSTLYVMGIPVVKNTGMTQGKFLVIERSKVTCFFRNDVRLETGRNGNDMIQNMVTSLAEARFATLIEQNDKTAIVYGTFSTAIAALTAGS